MSRSETYEIDGIRQQNAPIPVWWKRIMVGVLSFCPFYLVFYHTGAPGRSMEERYERALAADTKKKFAEIGTLDLNAATISEYMSKDNWVKVGKVVFKANCATCHGREGEGNVGPNLTDDSYKNIRNLDDVGQVILKGAANNAMPAWDGKLHPNEIVMVSAYVASLRGTNVAGGKSAEGSKIADWQVELVEAQSEQGND